ncbi:uncharacterized protein BJ171DRAFT_460294 [Polychytrium aggregatum]|uniref:uncharacterized protein n=1 Tax=Polychytrium aggregatum TaxID=110093 RepID=UPI0022FDF6B2|nr:uncharacterized protein BJ171DRAFT_460294 [Polychytrium aggregatum]KAI9203469.1 hypothetical protein BJ171DRAFT_460294 [Polychytrium aggregatum]
MTKLLNWLSLAGASLATLAAAQNTTNGKFEIIGQTGVVCIHLALLPNERFLCMERPHIWPYPSNPITVNDGRQYPSVSTELDPSKYNGDPSSILYTLTPTLDMNPFCSHHVQLPDGNVFVVGGDNFTADTIRGNAIPTDGHFARRLFKPCAVGDTSCAGGTWDLSIGPMTTKRWYPTSATLYDGTVIIFSGSNNNIILDNPGTWDPVGNDNPTYEYYPSKPGTWPRPLNILSKNYPYSLFPTVFQLPSKKVFVFVANETMLLDPATDTNDYGNPSVPAKIPSMPASITNDHQPWIYPYTSHSIMLPLKPPNYEATILICGGSKKSTPDASDMCISINPDSPNPTWTTKNPLLTPRLMIDGVIMADGKILYTNGGSWGQAGGNAGQAMYARGPNFQSEIYDPDTDTHTPTANYHVVRLYHSVALLAPSGYIYTAGSEMQNVFDIWGNTDVANATTPCSPFNVPQGQLMDLTKCTSPFGTQMERYTPPYLQTGKPRPVITSAPSSATYGSSIAFKLNPSAVDGTKIDKVHFVRYASTTHQTNSDQRLVVLNILGQTSDTIYVRLPPNGSVAPPGNWMLFALSGGVPSVAATVLFGPGAQTDVSIPPGVTTTTSAGSIVGANLFGLLLALATAFIALL